VVCVHGSANTYALVKSFIEVESVNQRHAVTRPNSYAGFFIGGRGGTQSRDGVFIFGPQLNLYSISNFVPLHLTTAEHVHCSHAAFSKLLTCMGVRRESNSASNVICCLANWGGEPHPPRPHTSTTRTPLTVRDGGEYYVPDHPLPRRMICQLWK